MAFRDKIIYGVASGLERLSVAGGGYVPAGEIYRRASNLYTPRFTGPKSERREALGYVAGSLLSCLILANCDHKRVPQDGAFWDLTRTTKPNKPYQGYISDNFARLEQINSLVGMELRKLHEFQDGGSDSQKTALDDLATLYHSNPSAFDNTFREMYKIGMPKVRRYCTPLQALFWLFEDGNHTLGLKNK